MAAGLVVLGVWGCDRVVPSGFQEKSEAMEEQVEVYVAAARAFQHERGRWPEDLEELFTMLRRTPRGDAITRIERVEITGETALMPFLVERVSTAEGTRPEVMGVVEVWPRSAVDEPAAEIHWEVADPRRERFGTVTLSSCRLGEYAAEISSASGGKC